MKKENFNPTLQAAYLKIVENQLRANDPPETRKTYKRLLRYLDQLPDQSFDRVTRFWPASRDARRARQRDTTSTTPASHDG